MFLNVNCNHCGIQVAYDDSREFIYCWSCGQKIYKSELNLENAQSAPAAQPMPAQFWPEGSNSYQNRVRAEGPNLIVTYQTTHPEYPLFFRIHSTNEKFYISPGQSMQFHLCVGRHALFFGFNGKFYRKNLWVLDAGPIRINCSWDTERRIEVLMPSAVYNPQGN